MDKIERFESDGEIHPSKRGGLVCFGDHYEAMAESAAKIAALERRCLIAEQAVVGFTRSPKSWLDAAEEFLIAEGKLPQREVKP